PGGLAKAGPGDLVLTTANPNTGATVVQAGRLILTNASALGSTSTGTTVTGGALEVRGNLTVAEPVRLNGSSTSPATLGAQSNSLVTWSGAVTLGGTGVLDDVPQGSRLALTGGLSGSGSLIVGSTGMFLPLFAGEVDFNGGTFNYTGSTIVNTGTLNVN